MSPNPKAILCWSSGKNSAWALHVLRQRQEVEVVGLLTTINEVHGRVAMHAVCMAPLQAQTEAVGLPLWTVPIPSPCSNQQYEMAMRTAVGRVLAAGVNVIAFGDLFLEDARQHRETQPMGTGLTPLFPIWGLSTTLLAREMISAGLRARLTCVDPKQIPASFTGRKFDDTLLADLPATADPCGERGEFHAFAYAGPMFHHSVPNQTVEIVTRDGFAFADLR